MNERFDKRRADLSWNTDGKKLITLRWSRKVFFSIFEGWAIRWYFRNGGKHWNSWVARFFFPSFFSLHITGKCVIRERTVTSWIVIIRCEVIREKIKETRWELPPQSRRKKSTRAGGNVAILFRTFSYRAHSWWVLWEAEISETQ